MEQQSERPKWAFDPTVCIPSPSPPSFVLTSDFKYTFLDTSDPWYDDAAAQHEATLLNRNDAIPLVVAAQTNDLARVQELLASGADVNAHGTLGETALHMACALGYVPIVRVLLEAGADVNARGADGRASSPLIHAARFCLTDAAPDIIDALLQAGADPTHTLKRDLFELTALQWAVHRGNVAAIPPLVPVCPHERVLQEATGSLRNAAVVVWQARRRGETSAVKAPDRRPVEVIKMLLELGVRPTKTDLREALFAGSWDAFELIKEKLALPAEEFAVFADEALGDLVYENIPALGFTIDAFGRRFFEVYGVDVNVGGIPVSIVLSGNVALLELAAERGLDLSSMDVQELRELIAEAQQNASWRGTPKDWKERIAAVRNRS